MRPIDSYPSLKNWFKTCSHQRPSPEYPIDRFIWETCAALCEDTPKSISCWCNAFQNFLSFPTSDFLDSFKKAESALLRGELNLMDFISEIGEDAIRQGSGKLFLNLMIEAADKIPLVAFRFLSAWSALNLNEFDTCLLECEKIDYPFAAVHTLQGQAYLESGRVREAIESLEIATKLTSSDVLTWFQLAKAYFLNDQNDLAWNAIKTCRKLAPQSAEVALLMGMIAAAEPFDKASMGEAFQYLKGFLGRSERDEPIITQLLKLSLRSDLREEFMHLATHHMRPSLMSDALFVKDLGELLRELQEKRWFNEASELLKRA